MKITFIIATLGSGGAERVLVTLANELCKKHQIKIIKFHKEDSFYKLDEKVLVESLAEFKFTNLYHKIASRIKKFFALKKAMKASHSDIFISFLDSTNIACIVANFGSKTPLIISEHSTQSYLKSKIWRALRRVFYPYCAALTVLSQNDKSYYEKFVKNVKVLFNPCHFTPQTNLQKENVVLFVGRLDENKNAAMFLRAVANLNKNLQNEYEFIIAGDGEQRANLEKLARNLGIKASFLGKVMGVETLYQRAKILCLCSFVEGLPTVLVESLFFEVVRVGTDYVNSAKDLIQDDLDGFIVPKDDDKAMSEKLTLLMNDESLRLRLAQRASKRCADFDTTNIVKKWLTLIDEVLEKKGAKSNLNSNLKPNLKAQNKAQNLGKKAEFQPNSSQNSKPKIKLNSKTKKAKQ